MKVMVLHSKVAECAAKDENDVTVQAHAVFNALDELGYEPVMVPFALDWIDFERKISTIDPAFVFNLVETVEGTGRLIHVAPSIMDKLAIPYTGCRTESIFLTSNKLLAKKHLQLSGVRTPAWFSRRDIRLFRAIPEGQYIVKSVWEHASIGLDENSVIFAGDAESLSKTMECRCRELGGDCFAEVFIDGREFNVSLLMGEDGLETLPVAEMKFGNFPLDKPRIVDYRAKWEGDSFEFKNTERSFEFLEEEKACICQLQEIARKCWEIFDLRGFARVDFRIDRSGTPWVLEVNANPCLSPDAGFYAAAQKAALNFTQVIDRIVQETLRS